LEKADIPEGAKASVGAAIMAARTRHATADTAMDALAKELLAMVSTVLAAAKNESSEKKGGEEAESFLLLS
jgi:hypothetical protein